MNILLINSLKQLCTQELQGLLNSCYAEILFYELVEEEKHKQMSFCLIYTPYELILELLNHENQLNKISQQLEIDSTIFIPIGVNNLEYFFNIAKSKNTITAWTRYLEIQYLLSSTC